MISNHRGWSTSLSSVLSTPCPRRSLQLCHKFMMRTFPPGSSSFTLISWSPSSFIIKKTAHYGFALFYEDSIRFPKKDNILLPLILWPLRHTTMAWVIPRSNLDMHTICPSCSQRQMENLSESDTTLFKWLVMPEGLTSAPTAFNDLWMIADMIDLTVIIIWTHPHLLWHMSGAQSHVQEVLWRLHTNRLLPEPILQVHITPANTSDICCRQRPHHDPIQSPDYPGLAWAPKCQSHSPFLSLPTFYQHFFMDILKHHTTHTPNLKGTTWNLLMSAIQLFKTLKGFYTHQSLPLDPRHPDHSQKLAPLTMPSHSSVITPQTVNSPIAFHSQTFWLWNSILMCMTKSYWQFFEAFKWWWHYLEGSALPIDMVINHQNLKYLHDQDPHASASMMVWISLGF